MGHFGKVETPVEPSFCCRFCRCNRLTQARIRRPGKTARWCDNLQCVPRWPHFPAWETQLLAGCMYWLALAAGRALRVAPASLRVPASGQDQTLAHDRHNLKNWYICFTISILHPVDCDGGVLGNGTEPGSAQRDNPRPFQRGLLSAKLPTNAQIQGPLPAG